MTEDRTTPKNLSLFEIDGYIHQLLESATSAEQINSVLHGLTIGSITVDDLAAIIDKLTKKH